MDRCYIFETARLTVHEDGYLSPDDMRFYESLYGRLKYVVYKGKIVVAE